MHLAHACQCLAPSLPGTSSSSYLLVGMSLRSWGPLNSWEPRLSSRLNWSSSLCAGQWELSERSAEDSLIERAGRSFSHVLTHHAVMNACHLSLRALLKTPSVESGSHRTHLRSRTLPSPLIAVWATTSDILHQRTVAFAPIDVQVQKWAHNKKPNKTKKTCRSAVQQTEYFQYVLEDQFNFLFLCGVGKRGRRSQGQQEIQIIHTVFLTLSLLCSSNEV